MISRKILALMSASILSGNALAGFAVGTLSGYYAHSRQKPFAIQILPGGFSVGLKREF